MPPEAPWARLVALLTAFEAVLFEKVIHEAV